MRSLKMVGIVGTILKSNLARLDKPYKLNFSVTYWCQSRCVHCVKPDEIILGDNQQIDRLKVGAHAVGASGLNEVKQTFERHYSGDMIRIKASGLLPIEITPEHPLLVRTSRWLGLPGQYSYTKAAWKEAKFISPKLERTDGDYLVVPKIARKLEVTSLSLVPFTNSNGVRVNKAKRFPLEFPLNKETAWLLGLYVAEGSTTKTAVRFSLNSNEAKLQEKIIAAARELGYTARKTKVPTGIICAIGSRILARALNEWCGKLAPSKKIPDFIMLNKDDNIIRAFLDGWDEGDGWLQGYSGPRQTSGWHHITTVSKVLATQAQLCYASLGIIANIQKIPKEKRAQLVEGRKVNIHDVYVVSYGSKQTKYMKTRIVDGNQLRPVRKVELVPYSGAVHNIETTDNTYLVSNAVVHNCSIWQIRPKGELTLDEIKEFAKKNAYFKWVELTGGEPFLRSDIVEIAKTFQENCKGLYLLTMPTNSLCSYDMEIRKIEEMLKLGIPNVVVTVSLDGYKELHDKIRGVPGNYDKAVRMFKGLQELATRYKNLVATLGFTVINANAGQFEKTTSEWMRDMPGLRYSNMHINIGQVSDNYYANRNNPITAPADLAMKDVELLLGRMKGERERGLDMTAKAYLETRYLENLKAFLATKKSPIANRDGELSVFLDSYGNVYPSIMTTEKLGNIREQGLRLDGMLTDLSKRNRKEDHFTACESYQSILGSMFKIW